MLDFGFLEVPKGCFMQFCKLERSVLSLVRPGWTPVLLLLCATVAWTQEQASPTPQANPPQATPDQMATPQTPSPAAGDDKNGNKGQSKDADAKQDQGSQSIKLGAGDLVDVNVYGVPELTTKARVSNDGDLYLPLIDYVHVADLSLEEAQKLVEKRLDDGGFVRNPHVTIFVNEYSSQGVTLMGEVAKPGVYPVLGDRRLFDVLSSAGGLSDKAGRTVVITHRAQPDKPETFHLARNLLDDPQSNINFHP
jgi:hypothetical protein